MTNRIRNYFISLLLMQSSIFPQNNSKIAVLDFNESDPGIQERLEEHLDNAQYLDLIQREVWFQLLSQKVKRDRFVPTNTSSAIKMGKIIKVDYIVYGISKYGNMSVHLVDVDNRSKIISVNRKFKKNQLAFFEMVPEIINNLDKKLLALTDYKKPEKLFAPPILKANLKFHEPSGNKILDALEEGNIVLEITNTGYGPGTGIITSIKHDNTDYLKYQIPNKIPIIRSDDSQMINIPIKALINTNASKQTLRFEFEEQNGFPPDPVEIQFSTKEYLKPELSIIDVGINDQNVNGMIEPGESIELVVRIGNRGMGVAKKAYARFYSDSDEVYLVGKSNKINLGDLHYDESKDIKIEFFITMAAKEEIQLFVDIQEETGLASVMKKRLPIYKSERARKIGRIVVEGIEQDYGQLTLGADLSIDIEQDIPEGDENKDAVAIVIGNKNYMNPDVPEVTFAHRDAAIVEQYLTKMLGYRDVIVETDATQGKFYALFGTDKKDGKLQDYIKKDESDVFIYYSGHGAPDPESNDGYFVPVDCDPAMVDVNGYSLDLFYKKMNDLDAKSVTVVIDACFSGSSDQGMLLKNISPVFIEVKETLGLDDKVTVFTSSSGEQVSSWYPDKKHSLYTYFFLKGLKGSADADGDRSVTAGEIQSYVNEEVPLMARKLNSREQTPGVRNGEGKVIVKF